MCARGASWIRKPFFPSIITQAASAGCGADMCRHRCTAVSCGAATRYVVLDTGTYCAPCGGSVEVACETVQPRTAAVRILSVLARSHTRTPTHTRYFTLTRIQGFLGLQNQRHTPAVPENLTACLLCAELPKARGHDEQCDDQMMALELLLVAHPHKSCLWVACAAALFAANVVPQRGKLVRLACITDPTRC